MTIGRLYALIRDNGLVYPVDTKTGEWSEMTMHEYQIHISRPGTDCYLRFTPEDAQSTRARILFSLAKIN